MRHRPSVFKCVLLTTGSFSNISSIHVTVLCSLFMSSVFAQPPFLSILSGIIAVVIYHFCGPKMAPSKEHAANKTAVTAQTKSYLMVFLVVAVLCTVHLLLPNRVGVSNTQHLRRRFKPVGVRLSNLMRTQPPTSIYG